MVEEKTLQKIHRAILSARKSLDSTEELFEVLLQKKEGEGLFREKNIGKEKTSSENETIYFGTFDGQNMVLDTGETYPIRENYASKSKLVQGDTLKLSIQENGHLYYKQIKLAPRISKTGTLILEGNQYKVMTDEITYKILQASVTFFHGNIGDVVTIIAPEDTSKEWAAVENIVPV